MSGARAGTAVRRGFPRRVEPELLDDLPAHDPRAVRSRRDLQRVNRLMGNASILLRELDRMVAATASLHLLELGAGDGSLMLRLAQRRSKQWAGVRLTLLDRQPIVSAATLAGFREVGWQVDVAAMDVFDWLRQPQPTRAEYVIANLFVHHFADEQLQQLLHGIAHRAQAFVCLEPRRSTAALVGSHLLGAIGCNAITRHDAVLSVHAGFRDHELTDLWPQSVQDAAWQLREGAAGPFGHLFAASRSA